MHFANGVTAAITWGRMPILGKRRRAIRFGAYFSRGNIIRIHPLLDQAFVPEYFVRYVVFHEMLHAAMETRATGSGRRRVHGGEFKRRERAYPDYDRAIAWETANLKKLLKGGSVWAALLGR